MADGLLQVRQADVPISTMTEDGIDDPRDMPPAIQAPGIVLQITKSGIQSLVTRAPLLPQGFPPDVVTDKTTHARTHTSTSTLSMVQQVMQTSTSSSAPSSTPVQHNRLTSEAPPPYTTTTQVIAQPAPQTTRSQSPIPRIDTPIFPDSPLLETAQMVHIRPISHHQSPQRNNQQPRRHQSDTLQPPDTYGNIRTRQDSSESEFSVHNRATLRQPFSPMASPTFSDVSGLSFDPTLWASVMYGRDSIISPIDADDQDATKERTSPHQIV
ncbi:MAG: hypothetical protein LQ342_006077 [Letrouitia transgressa]|nr:MAG: hypothetical protein LQ342_006077 [Letrouitia transgressa]